MLVYHRSLCRLAGLGFVSSLPLLVEEVSLKRMKRLLQLRSKQFCRPQAFYLCITKGIANNFLLHEATAWYLLPQNSYVALVRWFPLGKTVVEQPVCDQGSKRKRFRGVER